MPSRYETDPDFAASADRYLVGSRVATAHADRLLQPGQPSEEVHETIRRMMNAQSSFTKEDMLNGLEAVIEALGARSPIGSTPDQTSNPIDIIKSAEQ